MHSGFCPAWRRAYSCLPLEQGRLPAATVGTWAAPAPRPRAALHPGLLLAARTAWRSGLLDSGENSSAAVLQVALVSWGFRTLILLEAQWFAAAVRDLLCGGGRPALRDRHGHLRPAECLILGIWSSSESL